MAQAQRYNAAIDLLERNAVAGRAERPYLLTEDKVISYGEVIADAQGLGAALLGLGLAQGDRVLLFTQDRPEFVVGFWGAIRAGLIAVPISPLVSAADLTFVVRDSGARALIFDSSTERLVSTLEPSLLRIGVGGAIQDALPFAALKGDPAALAQVATTEDDAAFWQYTSGTTGTAKAARLRHGGLKVVFEGMARQVLDLRPEDVILSVSKMFYSYGLGNSVYLPAAAGASVVVHGDSSIPLAVQGCISRFRPTLLFGVPSFYAGYCKLPDADLGRIRLAVSAGEALSAELLAIFQERFGRPLLDGLGSTETMHFALSNRADDIVPGSVGRPLAGWEAQVRGPDGKVLPEGQRGELWVRGPTLFAGYWNRPDLDALMLSDGWLRTGDLVRCVDGRMFHHGRIDDLMKLGGVWVAPREIEDVLRAHPDVLEAAVVIIDNGIGVPVLKAFVRSGRADDAVLHKELARWCTGRLASFKVPRLFETVAELPRTASGKLKRAQLRTGDRFDPYVAKPGLMVVLFNEGTAPNGSEVEQLKDHAARHADVRAEVHGGRLTEVYLSGKTEALSRTALEQLPGVKRVVSISEKHRILGRRGDGDNRGFTYNGVRFDQTTFHVFAGLCAVDSRESVAATMAALATAGVVTTRMGAYKPRTSPYDFQGLERECLPYVFELAGKYGIRVIAMEVLHEKHIDEIRDALRLTGEPTGVLLQIGSRNAQNFELLKHVGSQAEFPILYKRGMGVSIEESLSACEYIASSGNPNIIFCLRGVKTHLGDPHRNLVDFAHVPVIKRLTCLPVCVDPSHSVGKKEAVAPADGLLDIFSAATQGVIVGANMVLVDLHPTPELALCDGQQALTLDQLAPFLEDMTIAREAYLRRCAAAARHAAHRG